MTIPEDINQQKIILGRLNIINNDCVNVVARHVIITFIVYLFIS